jgi:hypothetical protein
MRAYLRSRLGAGFSRLAVLALVLGFAVSALAQSMTVTLFKIITSKDEVEIGLTENELKGFGSGPDIEVLAKKLAADGQITVWQYVQRAPDSSTAHMPLKRIAIFKTDTLRIEPFNPAPLKAVPPQ